MELVYCKPSYINDISHRTMQHIKMQNSMCQNACPKLVLQWGMHSNNEAHLNLWSCVQVNTCTLRNWQYSYFPQSWKIRWALHIFIPFEVKYWTFFFICWLCVSMKCNICLCLNDTIFVILFATFFLPSFSKHLLQKISAIQFTSLNYVFYHHYHLWCK